MHFSKLHSDFSKINQANLSACKSFRKYGDPIFQLVFYNQDLGVEIRKNNRIGCFPRTEHVY